MYSACQSFAVLEGGTKSGTSAEDTIQPIRYCDYDLMCMYVCVFYCDECMRFKTRIGNCPVKRKTVSGARGASKLAVLSLRSEFVFQLIKLINEENET